jgi:S-DNA-T family DNA segregation ATPase FtsK/SpoIIIE
MEWEARDVAEKARRHQRVMDWVTSPVQLVKALVLGIVGVAGLLLALGIILAIGTGDASQVIGPIVGLITAIPWAASVITAYGALLLGATAACWPTCGTSGAPGPHHRRGSPRPPWSASMTP